MSSSVMLSMLLFINSHSSLKFYGYTYYIKGRSFGFFLCFKTVIFSWCDHVNFRNTKGVVVNISLGRDISHLQSRVFLFFPPFRMAGTSQTNLGVFLGELSFPLPAEKSSPTCCHFEEAKSNAKRTHCCEKGLLMLVGAFFGGLVEVFILPKNSKGYIFLCVKNFPNTYNTGCTEIKC